MRILPLALLAPLVLAACDRADPPATHDPAPNAANSAPPAAPTPPPPAPAPEPEAAKPAFTLIAESRTRAEWAKADNRATCAPLFLTDDAGADGTPRRAFMGGGWGVAFDQPGLRSAYGVAGAGVAVKDFDAEVARIKALWPYSRPLGARAGKLPAGSFAGYGLDGAAPFDDGNPTGKGQRAGAYVLIPGQGCLYNLWSQLGRGHLEAMLDGLTLGPAR